MQHILAPIFWLPCFPVASRSFVLPGLASRFVQRGVRMFASWQPDHRSWRSAAFEGTRLGFERIPGGKGDPQGPQGCPASLRQKALESSKSFIAPQACLRLNWAELPVTKRSAAGSTSWTVPPAHHQCSEPGEGGAAPAPRGIGVFPNETTGLRLAIARLAEETDWQSAPCFD